VTGQARDAEKKQRQGRKRRKERPEEEAEPDVIIKRETTGENQRQRSALTTGQKRGFFTRTTRRTNLQATAAEPKPKDANEEEDDD
jgi:hypothetical protein